MTEASRTRTPLRIRIDNRISNRIQSETLAGVLVLAGALLAGAACTGAPVAQAADEVAGGAQVVREEPSAAVRPDPATGTEPARVAESSGPLEPLGEAVPEAAEPVGRVADAAPEPSIETGAQMVSDPAAEPPVVSDPSAEPPPGQPVDAEGLLQASLQAFESAQVFWQQGDFEDAFAALDEAYELMAQAPINGDDPLLAQQKEDLRHLISRRVVEIYASRQTAAGDPNGEIRLEINEDVEREIKSFQTAERDELMEGYRRSGLYRPMILEELRKAGLPEQLSWMPMVESWFKVRALSRARALGMWQFISSTGYRYGLERTWWIDERMDPEKSTRAAIAYLTDLHNLFGDWLTALAAYNTGEGRVLREINRQRVGYFDRFWDVYQRLPGETRRYVPRFLATLAIVENPARYGFDLPEPLDPIELDVVTVDRAAGLEGLEDALGLKDGTLIALNPELRQGAVPDESYPLRVPAGSGDAVGRQIASLPEWKAPAGTGVHRVRRGETLSGIAGRYGTSVRELMALNRLRSAHRIWPGQQLQVPGGSGGARLPPGTEVAHRVHRGDSLWLLASRYGTTVGQIRRDNGLRGNTLYPGQVLRVRSSGSGSGSGGGGSYLVRSGDTLGAIARRQGISLSRLLSANNLSRRSTIYPGQRLVIPR